MLPTSPTCPIGVYLQIIGQVGLVGSM